MGGGGLVFGGAYTLRGLFSEFYGITQARGNDDAYDVDGDDDDDDDDG